MPWKRQTAFGRSSARSSMRSRVARRRNGTGRTHLPLAPASLVAEERAETVEPVALEPDRESPRARSGPKPKRASSGQPIASAAARAPAPRVRPAPIGLDRSALALQQIGDEIPQLAHRPRLTPLRNLRRTAPRPVPWRPRAAAVPRRRRRPSARRPRRGSLRSSRSQASSTRSAKSRSSSRLAQDRPDLADHQLEHGDLLVEQMQHLLLERAAGHEIEHEHLALLADAIDAADALLDRHRIPRHVEIDQRVAELDVAAFAARLGAKQHRHLVAERGDGGVLVGAAQARRRSARTPSPPASAGRRGDRASRGSGRRPASSRPDCAAADRAAPPPCRRCRRRAQRCASACQAGSSAWRAANRARGGGWPRPETIPRRRADDAAPAGFRRPSAASRRAAAASSW